jgi:hypothetical protein
MLELEDYIPGMKRISLILLFALIAFGAHANSNGSVIFGDALYEVSFALDDAKFDFDEGYLFRLPPEQKKANRCSKGVELAADELYELFDRAQDNFQSYYGDEPLPWDEAREDLSHIIESNKLIYLCRFDAKLSRIDYEVSVVHLPSGEILFDVIHFFRR